MSSKTKKPGLPAMDASAFAVAAIPVPDPVQVVTKSPASEKPAPAEAPKRSAAVSVGQPPSRAGKVQLGVWVPEEWRKELKREALESGRSVDVIVNDLIASHLQKR